MEELLDYFLDGNSVVGKLIKGFDFEFSFDLTNASNDRNLVQEEFDSPYGFNQSTHQAFYFIESIDAPVSDGDWILAYNNDVLVSVMKTFF